MCLWPMSLWGKEDDQRRYQRQTTSARKVSEVDGGRNRPIMNHAIVLHFTKHEHQKGRRKTPTITYVLFSLPLSVDARPNLFTAVKQHTQLKCICIYIYIYIYYMYYMLTYKYK